MYGNDGQADEASITAEALRTEVEATIGQGAAPLSDELDEAIENAVGEMYVVSFLSLFLSFFSSFLHLYLHHTSFFSSYSILQPFSHVEIAESTVDVSFHSARTPTADTPNAAAFLGGLVAQEAIKLVTRQYVLTNGWCVVDLVGSWTGNLGIPE